jgi:hypothetical protein
MERVVRPKLTKEQRVARLAQRAVRMTPSPRKGTRAARKREAIKEDQ